VKYRRMLMSVVALSMLSACSFVKTVPGSEKIKLLTSSDVVNCQKIGDSHTQTMHQVGFVNRSTETLTSELTVLAKNDAAKMGGNAVAPLSSLKDGMMMFGLYHCD